MMIYPSRGTARIGVLVPFTNSNLEPDMDLMRPEGVSIHFARMAGYDEDEVPDESQMADMGASDLDGPLRMIQAVRPDAILYGCTSATLTNGPEFDRSLAQQITDQSGAKTVTAAGALVHAIRALGVDKIGFASPYVRAINDEAVDFLATEGIDILSRGEVDARLGNEGQGALTPDEVYELGLRADSAGVQAVVLSCTDMRSVEVIARLEQDLGKPVVTSNQAMMFQTLQSLGLTKAREGYGQLFERIGQ